VRVVAGSHTLVWYLSRPERLTPSALEALSAVETSGQGIGVSAVTLIDLWHATREASQPVTAEECEAVKQVVTDPSSGVEVLAVNRPGLLAVADDPAASRVPAVTPGPRRCRIRCCGAVR
jgi:PIN domain nuclease of toxin-antitoxin system